MSTGADDRLSAFAPEMLEMLREIEWQGRDAFCGFCQGTFRAHLTNCKLRALLNRIGAEQKGRP